MEIQIDIPNYVYIIMNRLSKFGYESFVVGGCVRDSIMGIEPHDWDVATNALPEDIISIFSDYNLVYNDTSIAHGTVTVVSKGIRPVEVTTYRKDVETDGRHATVRFMKTIEADLSRRDFTINAMAYNEERGLVDPFGGALDIEARTITAVGNAGHRFKEDYLRMFRAVRFASTLDFSINPTVLFAMSVCAEGASTISKERVWAELWKTLHGVRPKNADYLFTYGVMEAVCPALNDRSFSFINGIDVVVNLTRMILTSSVDARTVLHELTAPAYIIKRVIAYIRAYEEVSVDPDVINVRKMMSKYGIEPYFVALKLFELEGSSIMSETVNEARLVAMGVIERREPLFIKDLTIDGKDVTMCGYSGKRVGDALNACLNLVLEHPDMNVRHYLICAINTVGFVPIED